METAISNRTTKTIQRAIAIAAGASALLIAGTAQAALEDRDLDGDTVVDAFYSTEWDITWLRNANVNGAMDWDTAVAWADGYSFGVYSDWRLPTMGICSINTGCNLEFNELAGLWAELGGGVNTGDFQNLTRGNYWSGTKLSEDDCCAWYFPFLIDPYPGYYYTAKEFPLYALAVHPGDIGAPVPEPESLALMLAGLTALALAVRRRPR